MRSLILVLAFCFSQIVWGAENTPPLQSTDENAAQDAAQQAGQDFEQEFDPAEEELVLAEVEEPEEEASASRFIPTEQISQDLGVSFPVDI